MNQICLKSKSKLFLTIILTNSYTKHTLNLILFSLLLCQIDKIELIRLLNEMPTIRLCFAVVYKIHNNIMKTYGRRYLITLFNWRLWQYALIFDGVNVFVNVCSERICELRCAERLRWALALCIYGVFAKHRSCFCFRQQNTNLNHHEMFW